MRRRTRQITGRFPWLSVSLTVVLGLMILSFHSYFYTMEKEERETETEKMKEEAFRCMDFGDGGFAAVIRWAEAYHEDPGETMAVWMMGFHYDLGGVAVDRLSWEKYEQLNSALQEAAASTEVAKAAGLENASRIYSALIEDLKVFPIPRNSDPACAFPTYENGWGDERTFGGERRHEGCDIMGSTYADGTYPVVSMTDGVVEKLGWLRLGGWRVGIRSDNGLYYYYAHLDSYAQGLKEGDSVQAGQEIGRMGSTGYSDQPGTSGNFAVHLHVGIYIPVEGQEDVSVNPYYLMRYLEQEHTMTAEYPWEERQENGTEASAASDLQ